MKRRDFIKNGVVLTAGLAAGIGLTGCGKETAATKVKPTIKIGYLPITDHLTIIAHGQTEYQQLNLEPVKFANWAELSEALKAGAVQGAFALTPIGIHLRLKGTPIQSVLVGHRNGSVITVKNTPELNKIEDLKGKTVAIPSRFSTHHILIRKALTEKGIDPDKDVTLLDMAPPEMVNALATGRIDGFIVAEPFGGQAEKQQVGKVLVLSKDLWKDHICCALNLQESVIQQNPEGVEELVGSFVKAAKFIDDNPREAAKLSQKYLGQNLEVIEHVLTRPKGRVTFDNLIPDSKDFGRTQDYMVQFGITQEKVDLAKYLDDRFAKKAYGA